MSHPSFKKMKSKPLYMCPGCSNHTYSNNMVNRYNISINYKLNSLQNDMCVQKKDYRAAQISKRRCGFHMHNWRRGGPSLQLLAPTGTLDLTSTFGSI
jgi:hypothetical protein